MPTKPDSARGRKPRPARKTPPAATPTRDEPALSLERIVASAVDMLDAGGVAGLTMRGLAARLEAGAMSLYWHVDSKEKIFDLALDAVLAYRPPSRGARTRDWRGELIAMLEDWRAIMLRHPWSAALLPQRALGSNILARLELLGGTLSKAGVADKDLNVAIWSLWNYVIGATVTRASFDLTDADRTASQQRLEQLSGDYPTIGRSHLLMDDDWDGAFRKGLGFLLDGITAR